MGKNCCFGGCKSDSRKEEPGVTFQAFPNPARFPTAAKRWASLCEREGFTVDKVTRHTYICSKHFEGTMDFRRNPWISPLPSKGEVKLP